MGYKTYNKSQQKGAALLAFLILFIVVSSYTLVSKLNANSREYLRRGSSLSILNDAKAALIGYAINYPLDHVGEPPGYLPCPDIINDGVAGGSCSLAGGTSIGRLPYKTLELNELRDASGQRLWYAVSDNYKNNPKVLSELNSDSPGNFSVNGNSDIVAVIFAPGPPLDTQDRAGAPLAVANYLDDDNADGDNSFITLSSNDFNDTLVTITRQELMSAVEKRILGDVNEALISYQNNYNAFPWLSPFADPSSSTFRGALNTAQGHLPFHWSADPDSIEQGGAVAGRNPFVTNLNFSWDFSSAIIYEWPTGTSVTVSCVQQTNCGADDPIAAISSITLAAGCTWSDQANPRQRVDCTMDQNGSWSEVSRYSADNLFRRRYVMRKDPILEFYGDVVNVTGAANTTLRTRTRTVAKAGFSLTNSGVSDVFYVIDYTRPDIGSGWTLSDYASATITSATLIDSISLEIPYDLDIDGVDLNSDGDYVDTNEVAPELPSWFVANGWHELVYLAYASGETLPGDTTVGQDCVSLGTTCVSVTINGTLTSNVRAAVFSAGVDLSPLTARPNGILSDYFEGENSSPVDDLFIKDKMTTTYNDQTRIISTAP